VDLNRDGDHIMRVYPPKVRIPPHLGLARAGSHSLIGACMSVGRRWCVVVRPFGPPTLGFRFDFPGMSLSALGCVCRLREIAADAIDDEAYVRIPAIGVAPGTTSLDGINRPAFEADLIAFTWSPEQIAQSIYY
jgi:hypothetical protein